MKGGRFAIKHREHGMSGFDFKMDIVVRVTGPHVPQVWFSKTDMVDRQEEEKKGVEPLKGFTLRRKPSEAIRPVADTVTQGGDGA